MHLRFARSAPVAVVLLIVGTATAPAAELGTRSLSASGATPVRCHAGLSSGPGIVQRPFGMAPAAGTVSAVLDAASGDWDVAVFDRATGRAVAAAAGFGPDEVATGFVGGGRPLVLQACRRRGTTRATVTLRTETVPSAGPRSRPSLVKVFVTDPAQRAWVASAGFDLTEHAGHDYVEVVAYGQRDLDRLARSGLRTSVEVADLVAEDRLRAATDRGPQLRAAGDGPPSGRTSYRRLADYEADLKKLVDENPGLVRPIVLPRKTVEGRAVNGIEITTNVNVLADGKPVFLQTGVHHAREWPSGEHPMEWAFELVNGVRSGDAELTKLVSRVRTIVVPVLNVDGFNVSREAPVDLVNDPQFATLGELAGGLNETAAYLVDPALNYKRRNCRLVDGTDSIPAGACATPPFRLSGVDPNRNYGGRWGGPGASALSLADTYRGAAPFSEAETQNIRELTASRQITTFITNHTFSNLILRAYGVRAAGRPVDEAAMEDLGERMAAKNGYVNQPSYMLYDTTGGAEDWTYGTAGGFGYTFEIGPDKPAAEGGGFHPPFSFTTGQYNAGSNGAGGNRAAYRLALQNAADPRQHSTITGAAPAGVTLRVRKDVVTETSPVEPLQTDPPLSGDPPPSPAGDPIRFGDTLQSTLDISRTGAFSWAVNPSTRPIVDQVVLPGVSTAPTREETFRPRKQTEPNLIGGGADTPGTFEDVPFTVTTADSAKALRIRLTADSALDDYDLRLFKREGAELKEVDSAGAPLTMEELLVDGVGIGDYVLRVDNYLAVGPWTAVVSRLKEGDGTVRPRSTSESWKLTCEAGGQVLASQKVEVDRGRVARISAPCGANAAAVVASALKRAAGPRCATSSGFKSVGLNVLGRRRARLQFARRVAAPVTVEVFRVSAGSRVLPNRRVGRFTRRATSPTFSPRGLPDGVYFARFSVRGARKRIDRRRVTFSVSNGRIKPRRAHHRPESCGLLSSAKLASPVFGGATRRPLRIALRTTRRAQVVVQVRRGKKVVRRFRLSGVAPRSTRGLTVGAARLRAKGDYTVRITARAGKARATSSLLTKRL